MEDIILMWSRGHLLIRRKTYPFNVAIAVQNCILRKITAHLCLYSWGIRTRNVVDDCIRHKHDVMTNKTEAN